MEHSKLKMTVSSSCCNEGCPPTVKDFITIQHKINIFGVTTAYYLSFLNFYTCFDAYNSIKKPVLLLASVRRNAVEAI